MKKVFAIGVLATLFSFSLLSQTQTEISELVKLGNNDINNKTKMIPLELRENTDTTCNTYFSRVGMSVITKPLISKYDEEGKRYNEVVTRYESRIHVTYDCKEYQIILYDEPIIVGKDEIENLNPKSATKQAVVIFDGEKYVIKDFDYSKLRPVTQQRLQAIGEAVFPPAKKMFSKIIKE